MTKPICFALWCALVGGCASHARIENEPAVVMPAQFDQGAEFESGKASVTSSGRADTQTFSAFGSNSLNTLIERALAANTSLAQAKARLDEARAYRGLNKYSLFPTVQANAEQTRSRVSEQDPQAPPGLGVTESFDIGADVAWEIDLFGSLSNQRNAIWLRADLAQAALIDVQRIVVADVALGFFQALGARERVRISERNLANLRESERIVEALLEAGRGTELDLARAKSLRFGLEAGLANQKTEETRQLLRLASLTTQPVTEVRKLMATETRIPDLPELRQLGTPEQWLKRRPDVQAAQLNLAAAVADAGAQRTEFFPKINLLGSFGSVARDGGALFENGTGRWRFGPSISWEFLNVGRVNQLYQAELAQARSAHASYQETVLRALEEVELALANFRGAQEANVALAQAAQQAEKARALAELRFEAGASDYLVVLDAQRQRLNLDDQHIQAQTARAAALTSLYKALAGDFAAAQIISRR